MDFCKKVIVTLFMGGILVGCAEASQEVSDNNAQSTSTNITSDHDIKTDDTTTIERHMDEETFERLKEMLKKQLSHFTIPLNTIPVQPDLSERKSIYSEGYNVEGYPIVAMFYLFENGEDQQDAFDYLHTTSKEGKYHVIGTTSGVWLLWIYSDVDGEETENVVYDLINAFIGEE